MVAEVSRCRKCYLRPSLRGCGSSGADSEEVGADDGGAAEVVKDVVVGLVLVIGARGEDVAIGIKGLDQEGEMLWVGWEEELECGIERVANLGGEVVDYDRLGVRGGEMSGGVEGIHMEGVCECGAFDCTGSDME